MDVSRLQIHYVEIVIWRIRCEKITSIFGGVAYIFALKIHKKTSKAPFCQVRAHQKSISFGTVSHYVARYPYFGNSIESGIKKMYTHIMWILLSRAQSFTSFMADLCQDIKIVSSFSRCLEWIVPLRHWCISPNEKSNTRNSSLQS